MSDLLGRTGSFFAKGLQALLYYSAIVAKSLNDIANFLLLSKKTLVSPSFLPRDERRASSTPIRLLTLKYQRAFVERAANRNTLHITVPDPPNQKFRLIPQRSRNNHTPVTSPFAEIPKKPLQFADASTPNFEVFTLVSVKSPKTSADRTLTPSRQATVRIPREMTPSIVYIVKGEGVRDNCWEVQRAPQPVVYSNPPVERLDAVPTPLGSNLSIRIFEKGTKPVPNFLPPSAPGTAVVAPQAKSMPPTVSAAQKSPPAAPARPSPPVPQAANPKPVAPNPQTRAPTAAPLRPQFPHNSRRLANFRRLSTPIIANPNTMPASRPAAAAPLTSPPLEVQPPRPAHQPVARNAHAKPTPVSPVPSAKPRPRVPLSPTAPVQAPRKVHASPPRVAQAGPQGASAVPHLAVPGPSSPKTALQQVQVTSPSAFGRWKTFAPVAPHEQRSPQLPSPTKPKTPIAERARAKPWEKLKTRFASQTSFEVQRKAMDSIVAKARAHQPKAKKPLPPLTPLTPPLPCPTQAGPVSPRVPPATAGAAPDSQRVSPDVSKPKTVVKHVQKDSAPTADAQLQRPHPAQEPAPQRPAVDMRKEVRKDAAVTPHVKAPAARPSAVPEDPARKAPMSPPSTAAKRSEPPKPTERKLIHKESKKPSTATARVPGLSEGHRAGASDKPATAKAESLTGKKRLQSVEAPADRRPAPSPRSSIDGYEIGTAARPIVTKEDLVLARRKRDAPTGAPKAPRADRPAPSHASARDVRTEKEQRATAALTTPSAPKASGKKGSNDLFSSEIQESMKSVIEQVLWTVRHYKRRYGISLHDEMKSNKKRILKFIQTHLEEAASAPNASTAVQGRSAASGAARADAETKRPSPPKGKESANIRDVLRPIDFKEIKTYQKFKNWRNHFERGHPPLQALVVESRQLRDIVLDCDASTIYFSVPELLTRLKELGELAFTINTLNRKLTVTGKEIASHNGSEAQLKREFQHAFNVIQCAVHWVLFLSEQVTMTRRELMQTGKDVEKFVRDIYGFFSNTNSAAADETLPIQSIVKAIRPVKSTLGRLEKEIDMPDDGESLSGMIGEAVRTLAKVCQEGHELMVSSDEAIAAPAPANQDRAASSSPATRAEAIPRKPRHEEKPDINQESRNIKRKTAGAGGSSASRSSEKPKPAFEPRGRARTMNGSSAAPKMAASPDSLPVVPRRPPNAEPSASVPSSQAGSGTQRRATGSGSIPRRLNEDRPNLRMLMESARTVDQVRDDKARDPGQAGTKRKAEDDGDQKPLDSDTKHHSKKKKVQFATVLVQGAQTTSYSKKALSSLFSDGYDLLGESSDLQKTAVEERASQLSRGSVIATFGFIRSYITALKAQMEGRPSQRPVWVKLPYTPTMKREILRFRERRGNGLRSAAGPS